MPSQNRLREARVAALLSQKELGHKAGVTPNTISRIERGTVTPSYQTARYLARALGLQPQDIFFGPKYAKTRTPEAKHWYRKLEPDEVLTVRVPVRVSKAERERLDLLAESLGCKMSAVVRAMIRTGSVASLRRHVPVGGE